MEYFSVKLEILLVDRFLKNALNEKNFRLKSKLFQRSELTMCFIVESMRITVDSTRKFNLNQCNVKFISIFKINQLEFLLIQLQNTSLIQIF